MGDTLSDAAAGFAKGAAFGSIVPGVGTVIGGAAGAALAVAPDVGRWLFGKGGEAVAEQVTQAVEAVTGTSDPAAQMAAIEDPSKATELRVRLAEIAGRAQAARDAHREKMEELANADRQKAREADASRTGVLRFATLGFSVVLLGAYFAFLAAGVVGYSIPAPDDMANLRTLAIAAAFYWVGSSRGSAAKDEREAKS